MRWARILALCLWLPASAMGQTIEVRSGEHGAYTRLVMYLPRQADWAVTRPAPRRMVLTLPDGASGFDLTQVYTMISRDRIAGLSTPRDGVLVVTLGCDCDAAAFLHNDRYLVIDVGRVPATPTALRLPVPKGQAGDARPSVPPTSLAQTGFEDDAHVRTVAEPLSIRTNDPSEIADQTADQTHVERATGLAQSAGGDETLSARSMPDLDLQLHDTSEQVLDIAAHEVDSHLELPITGTSQRVLPILPEQRRRPIANALSEMLESELQAAIAAGLLGASRHVAVTTAYASPPDLLTDTPGTTMADRVVSPIMEGGYCPPDISEGVRLWAGEEPYLARLSQLRAATVDSTGQPVESAERALAQFYVAYGQGYEALVLLADDTGAEADLLRAMASTLEHRPNVPRRAFSDCPGLAPWDVMRRVVAGDGSPGVDAAAAVEHFQRLPIVLQALFQAAILRYLDENGHRAAFDRLSAYLTRTDETPKDHRLGTPDQPLSAVDGPSHDVPMQLLNRFATLTAAEAAPQEDRQLLDSYRLEYRGTRDEPQFWAASLRVALVDARYNDALDMLEDGAAAYPDIFAPVFAEASAFIVARADDISFLRMAMALGDGAPLPFPQGGVNDDIQTRLSLLGF